jgi:hypothetical protein
MSVDGVGLRILTERECFARLATAALGRVGVSWRALPMILPVHFELRDHSVVVHALRGSTLDRASDGTVVAFEAEGPAGLADPMWSVIGAGLATHHHAPWPTMEDGHVEIEIDLRHVSGREVLDATDPLAPVNLAALPRW